MKQRSQKILLLLQLQSRELILPRLKNVAKLLGNYRRLDQPLVFKVVPGRFAVFHLFNVECGPLEFHICSST